MSRNVEIIADGLKFPEGPVFDPEGRLWLVELEAGTVDRLNSDGSFSRYSTGGIPNGLACDASGHIYLADKQKKVQKFDDGCQCFLTLAAELAGQPLAEPNDICFDSAGQLVFTCPGGSGKEPIGYLCRLRGEGELTKIAGGLRYPNGLAFDADGTKLYVAESREKRLLVSDYDPGRDLELEEFCVLSDTGGPDGIALDADGNIWSALFGAGEIAVTSPDGEVIERVPLPGARPTNVAFDPSGRLGLVVTEAEKGLLLSVTPAPAGLPLLNGLVRA